jgi:polysaccharide deacetylase family protein (PEP-CTERM system associated)
VCRSKDLLEQILGEPVRGYRAPDFSIMRHTLWALEVLAEAGFEYDSSIFPIRRMRYGIPDWPVGPVTVFLSGQNTILEVPIGTFRCLGRNWPIGGGGYHRLFPSFVSRYLARKTMSSTPFVFYCHPYEFDAKELKEIPIRIPFHIRLHQGLGRRWFKQRFILFLNQFGGRRIDDFLLSNTWPELDLGTFLGSPSKMMWCSILTQCVTSIP